MDSLQTFRINSPTVVFEIFDEEIVIIHLKRGTYYSLDQSGAEIWQLLQQGATSPEIVARMAAAYALNPKEIEPPVGKFLTELIQEQLIAPNGVSAQSHLNGGDKAMGGSLSNGQRHFIPPSLNKYTDMQDLLLLDPIHEVDAGGWPRT